MAFVEEAVLKIIDDSSPKIRKINRELKELFRTADKLKGRKLSTLGIDTRGLKKARSEVNALVRDMQKLRGVGRGAAGATMGLPSASRINAATAAMNAYGRSAQRAASVRFLPPPMPRGGGGGFRPSEFGGRRGGAGGMSFGFAVGSSVGLVGGFNAVVIAAYAAARGLEAVGRSAATRDRTNLLLATAATDAQREIIEQAAAPEGAGPIRFTDDERRRFAQSLLGDVSGTEEQKARSAVSITAMLEKDVLPRLFAARPDESREDVQQGLRKLVQGMNLASEEIVDTAGNMTQRGLHVLRAQQLAMAADPDLDPQLMKTVLANLKTAAFSMSTDQLATTFINAGARGQRVANEAYRAMQAMMGDVKNATLNNALAAKGLLQNVTRNRLGNVEAGSGTLVDEALAMENFNIWAQKYIGAPMEEALSKVTPEIPPTLTERIQFINDMFSGANAPAKQGLVDAVLGDKQMQASLDQARAVLDAPITADLEASWTAQMNNVAVSFKDSAASFGEGVAEFVGAASILKNIAEIARGENTGNSVLDRIMDALGGGGGRDTIAPPDSNIKPLNDWSQPFFRVMDELFGVRDAGAAGMDLSAAYAKEQAVLQQRIAESKKLVQIEKQRALALSEFDRRLDRAAQGDAAKNIDRTLFPSRSFAMDAGLSDLTNEILRLADAEDKARASTRILALQTIEEDRATRAKVRRDATSTEAEKAAFVGKTIRETTAAFGGKEATRQIQLRVGAFADGLFGPQTMSMYQQAIRETLAKNAAAIDRQEILSARKDADLAPDAAGAGGTDMAAWTASLETGAMTFDKTFVTGADALKGGIEGGLTTMAPVAGQTFGTNAMGAMDGSTFGAQAAAAFNANARVATPTINVNGPKANGLGASDTGMQGPL